MAQGLKLGAWLLLAAVAGCGKAPTAEQPVAADSALLASDLLLRDATPQLEFSATLAPEMALAPALAREIIGTARQYQTKMQADAAAAETDAKAGGYPARPYSVIQRWTGEAETPALLAFSGLLWEYTGGAHGNSNYDVALYNRTAGSRIATADLFTDPKAALAALQPVWCAALADARRQKRGNDTASGFDDCPALSDLPMLPYGQGTVTALKVLAAPYVAGPYAEGSYEVLLDPTAALPFLKPEWRATFGQTDTPG